MSGEIFSKHVNINQYLGDIDASSQQGIMEAFHGNWLIFYNKMMIKSFNGSGKSFLKLGKDKKKKSSVSSNSNRRDSTGNWIKLTSTMLPSLPTILSLLTHISFFFGNPIQGLKKLYPHSKIYNPRTYQLYYIFLSTVLDISKQI